jgi:multidrug resistance efflux pump
VISEAGKNRFFSGSQVHGSAHELRQKLAQEEIAKERVVYEILQVENLIERCQVRSTVRGKVYHLNRSQGDYVREGDYVLTVAPAQKGPVQIVAQFGLDDAEYLQLGEECALLFASHDGMGKGQVVAIGRSGLASTGVLSPDQETAVTKVPVKINLIVGPRGIQAGEGVFVKMPRHWSIRSFLKKLS